ncbi:MAG: hypothetical protein O3A95_01760 [Planctomycetota bacterium]|nr:hypothetical protein [Planctomycetota bacterium]MDA1113009.1 hypothetical protein [Planctomycetota bacterium]
MELILLVLVLLLLGAASALIWRVHGRMAGMEERLKELSALAFLPDRVQALAKELEALAVDDVHAELEQLHQDLVRLEDVIAVPVAAPVEPPSRIQMVRALVTRFLREEGFLSVVIESEDAALDENPVFVSIHAVRKGVLVQGTVEVVDDHIAAVSLDPSYSTFP